MPIRQYCVLIEPLLSVSEYVLFSVIIRRARLSTSFDLCLVNICGNCTVAILKIQSVFWCPKLKFYIRFHHWCLLVWIKISSETIEAYKVKNRDFNNESFDVLLHIKNLQRKSIQYNYKFSNRIQKESYKNLIPVTSDAPHNTQLVWRSRISNFKYAIRERFRANTSPIKKIPEHFPHPFSRVFPRGADRPPGEIETFVSHIRVAVCDCRISYTGRRVAK